MEGDNLILYYLPYKNPAHPMFAPSVFIPIEKMINTRMEYTLELVFAEDDGLVCPIYKTIQSTNLHIVRPIDFLSRDEYLEDCLFEACGEDVFSLESSYYTLTYTGPSTDADVKVVYESFRELRDHLISIRIVEYHRWNLDTGDEIE